MHCSCDETTGLMLLSMDEPLFWPRLCVIYAIRKRSSVIYENLKISQRLCVLFMRFQRRIFFLFVRLNNKQAGVKGMGCPPSDEMEVVVVSAGGQWLKQIPKVTRAESKGWRRCIVPRAKSLLLQYAVSRVRMKHTHISPYKDGCRQTPRSFGAKIFQVVSLLLLMCHSCALLHQRAFALFFTAQQSCCITCRGTAINAVNAIETS